MGVHNFPKGIYPKVNMIAQLEFKLAYYDSSVQHFNHYTHFVISPLLMTNGDNKKWLKFFKILICLILYSIDYHYRFIFTHNSIPDK